MVAISGIKYSFRHACRYRSGLIERGLSVMCFPSGVGIERLHVHGPPWFPILLRAYDHPVAVCHWVANGDRLDHTRRYFSFCYPGGSAIVNPAGKTRMYTVGIVFE